MPRRADDAAFVKPTEPEECLEFDDHEEEVEEEEIEYEEIEEEVEEEEVEEEEDILEEVEESEEEEEEEDPEEREDIHEVDARDDSDSKLEGVPEQDDTKDGKDKEKHAELLALPPHGSEVYVGGISGDATSEDLKELCKPVGEVVEVRIMPGKKDRYAFVTFTTNDLALKAIEKLNNATFKGKKIRVSPSQAKNKLFVGNIPHSWAHDDLKKAVEEVGPGVLKIDLIKDPRTDRNRGYGFVQYYNTACAEYSRQKMSSPDFKLGTNAPNVSWADVKNADSASAGSTSQGKSVYVKNLPKNVTLAQLKKLFEHHGEITKVVLPPSKNGHDKRYGFVHFKNRHMAMKALKNTEKYELDGQLLDCSLAKPPSDKKDEAVSVSSAKGGPLLHAPLGYGIMPRPDAYGAPPTYGVPPAYGAPPTYGAQPLLYAPGAPPGAAMVPMLLPDGRLVYVVQQPAVQQNYASPPPQARQHQHQHFSSPSSQARQSGCHGGGGGSGGSSRSGSGAKRPRGDDNNSSSSRNKGRQRR